MNNDITSPQLNVVMNKDENNSSEHGSNANRKRQFGISAIFWATFVIALAISYLQNTSSTDVLLGGAASVIIGVAVGFAVGISSRKLVDSLVWSTLIAAFGYICVSTDTVFPMNDRITWATIGATAGALAATCSSNRIGFNILVCAAAALAIMAVFVLKSAKPMTGEMTIDLIAAPVVGALVAAFIQVLSWVETKHSVNRYFTATALMIMIVVGNAAATFFG